MPVPWKAWKSKSGFSTLSTAPWKSRKQHEIPTFPQPGFAALEKWKTKSRFPTFPAPLATTTVVCLNPKPKKGSQPLRGLLILAPALAARYGGADFMLIFQLENANPACSTKYSRLRKARVVGSVR
jgi:hypothetical protein